MKPRSKFWFFLLTLSGLILMQVSSCKKENLPKVATVNILEFTQASASSGSKITDDGGAMIISRGVCWSKSQNPTINHNKTDDGTGAGYFVSSITGLTPSTTYYVRAYATNSAGTAYGEETVFRTYQDYIFDEDGNGYGTIIIGEQEWMAENLKTTTYNNGVSIPNVSDDLNWAKSTSGAYCWYENDKTQFGDAYGALYNWHAVNTGILCPKGWHVPTDAEWGTLVQFIDPTSSSFVSFIAGGKLKSTRTAPDAHPRWDSPNVGATDEYGFSALPAGYRDTDGTFDGALYTCFLWSSSEKNALFGQCRGIYNIDSNFGWSYLNKQDGFSVRCLRDS